MYRGYPVGRPRYCPSIEDKVHASPQVTQIFLERKPSTNEIYPTVCRRACRSNAQVSSSTRSGLEKAELVAPGYAIE